jgi:hypothetical protein
MKNIEGSENDRGKMESESESENVSIYLYTCSNFN